MSQEHKSPIVGFLVGAAVGSLLGILFAPASGKETRERIVRKARSSKEDLDDFIDHARDEWGKAKGKASDAATMTKDEVSDFVRFLFEEGADLKERLKRDVQDSAEDVAERARHAAKNVRNN
jgi:gas vesicle protein